MSNNGYKKSGNDDNNWTKTLDKISLKPNGHNIHEIELILNKLIGPIEKEWKFMSLSPRIYVYPDISVKKTEREKIVEILKLNNLLLLPRGF